MAALPPPNIKPMTSLEAQEFLTKKGAPFELELVDVRGEKLRCWKHTPQSARHMWQHSVKEYADREYIVYSRRETGEEVRITYGEAGKLVGALANVLADKYGIKKGKHVALAMRNYPEWIITWWAVLSLGAVVVNVNCFLTPPEMEYCILDGESVLLIADGERAQLLGKLDTLAKIPMLVARPENYSIPRGDKFEALVGEYVKKGKTELPEVQLGLEDNACIFFTSGTTGKPKGALHTHRGVVGGTVAGKYGICVGLLKMGYGPEFFPKFNKEDPQSVCLVPTPLFHVTASTATTVPYTSVGTKCILMYKWDIVHAMELIQREKITSFAAVPSMHIGILEHPDVGKYDLSSLQAMASGGAPAPSSFADNVKSKFPLKVPTNGWGMSETLIGVVSNSGDDLVRKPTSIGLVSPNHDVKYVDANGKEVPVGEIGELAIRGPQVLKEYYKKDEATKKSFLPGRWFLTGDVGKVDEEGFHYIVDRAKDMVIRGGENIYCIDVENALYDHPAVLDAAAVGLPHRVLGEEVAAVVTLKPEFKGKVSTQELIDHCKKKLASFKVPVFMMFWDEILPRNPTGKIVKPPLRDAVKEAAVKVGVAKL
ncbi:AMP-dependent synthetase and ligase [Hyaloraphidium curvatum]|nr:AMP-dependent synthetase and ligase [Hyaloraphidium curvatum]